MERGKVVVNEYFEINVEGIYVIGDIIDIFFLVYVVFKEGIVVVENVLGKIKVVDYRVILRCVYIEFEVVGVGKIEK